MSRSRLVTALALGCAACASGRGAGPGSPSGTDVVAFVHATVIPMDTERLVPDQTVITSGGRILAIGPSASVQVPRAALRIDATGRYLLPALADMHVHLLSEAWNLMLPPGAQAAAAGQLVPHDDFLFPFIANGVTMVQGLSATPPELVLRQRIERGEVLGPRLILARMIDGPGKAWPQPLSVWVGSAAEAREAVDRAKAEGYDKMKVSTSRA